MAVDGGMDLENPKDAVLYKAHLAMETHVPSELKRVEYTTKWWTELRSVTAEYDSFSEEMRYWPFLYSGGRARCMVGFRPKLSVVAADLYEREEGEPDGDGVDCEIDGRAMKYVESSHTVRPQFLADVHLNMDENGAWAVDAVRLHEYEVTLEMPEFYVSN